MPAAFVPAKKCEVNIDPTGTDFESRPSGEHTPIILTEVPATLADGLPFECKDEGFVEATIPMLDEEVCDSTVQAQPESVRRCRGEPYHADYFEQDTAKT